MAKVKITMSRSLSVTDSHALRRSATPKRRWIRPTMTGGHPRRIGDSDAAAVFELWPQEALRDLVYASIPGVFVESESFGTTAGLA